ncbi:MAG: tetratricopeptide repeat protein [Bdellovibrionaceae bacterium]|nr:tetratricopeptide repeat protein [Pseudobdellovibrionaceae bacterium]MBX3032837.1 tetratricopeptide repeat protein [Pseudobdellovibrionaceae bacterium]
MLENELRRTSSVDAQAPARPSAPSTRNTDIVTGTLLANARVLRQHGELSLALNLLREASNRDSKNPAVLLPLAEVLEEAGRHGEALKVRQVMARLSYGFENVFQLAQALYRMNRDQEALHSYYEALSLLTEDDPCQFEIHKNMGNIFVRGGDFEGAEESYNRAYGLNATSDILMVNLGTLEVQRADKGRALSCFRQAVEINPLNEKAWTGLAMIHNEFGDHDLAWGNLERALDLNPGNRTAVHLAALWATRDQSPQRAIPWMEKYLASVESDEEMSLVLVNLFCSAGHLDLAMIESGRVLSWNPGREDVKKLRDRLHGLMGE